MTKITSIDTARFGVAISRDLRMALVENRAGPRHGVDGLLVTFAEMTRNPPHAGEQHPDGDELIYIVSGRVRVSTEASEDQPCELGPGDACIVPQGEWHRVRLVEPTRLIAITAGPNANHRPLPRAATPKD
jgi:quercetin dioxygenase-like cupin family protein